MSPPMFRHHEESALRLTSPFVLVISEPGAKLVVAEGAQLAALGIEVSGTRSHLRRLTAFAALPGLED